MESIEGTALSTGPQGIAAAGPVGVDHSMELQPGPFGSIEGTASSPGPHGSLDGTPTRSPGIQGCALESRPAAPTIPGPYGIHRGNCIESGPQGIAIAGPAPVDHSMESNQVP